MLLVLKPRVWAPRTAYATGPALVDVSALVDEEVVAAVAPAHALDVVPVDTANERGCLCTAVSVAGRRVVHEGRLDLLRVDERPLAQLLVGSPAAPGDD